MYISRIDIEKFRHLESARIGPLSSSSPTSDLIALAGPNGGGKSSVLELIGYALSQTYSLSWALSRSFSEFSFEVAIGLTADEKQTVIRSLDEELGPAEAALQEEMRKLEIDPAIDPKELETQRKALFTAYQSRFRIPLEIKQYLERHNVYYRAFNYQKGEYAKNQTLQNQIHAYVTKQLKDVRRRSLGFFLKSDRNYPQKAFDKKRIFAFEGTTKKEHLWSLAFNTSEIQYNDMYEFLVQQRYHYLRDLGKFHSDKDKGGVVGAKPEDPFQPYEELLHQIFPDYKFEDEERAIPTNLFVSLPSGEVIPFNDLSSGEKEVFFILSFFVRHNVEYAIIVIDEPELHLHPELSRLLIRSMKAIRPGNQIWVATHNSEIIDEAGRDRVIYVSRDLATRKAIFTPGTEEQDVLIQLRNLFGFSGYIGVAKTLVFLEGENGGQDRKFMTNLFPRQAAEIKFVPASGSGNLPKINAAVLSILEANLGWMHFSLIRDRDYLTDEMATKYESHHSGRIFVLRKHEIENYLIDFEIFSHVLKEIFEIVLPPEAVKSNFYSAALEMSSDVLRDMISFRLNWLLQPQDFSIGKILNKDPLFQADENGLKVIEQKKAILEEKFAKQASTIRDVLDKALEPNSINTVISECESQVKAALESEDWLILFPGKTLIEAFAKKIGIAKPISLQNSVIKELASHPERVDSELTEILSNMTAESLQ